MRKARLILLVAAVLLGTSLLWAAQKEATGVKPVADQGASWKPLPNAKAEKRLMEIPLENVVVRFP